MESKAASLKEGSDSSILEKDAAFTIRTVPVLDTVNETEEEIARDTAEAFTEFTDGEYKKLLRKIDIMIVPLMWIAYGVQQADKLGLSTQATLGLRTDLHLVGNQYALLSTFFYVSYLAFEFPFAWLMQKVPIGKTLGVVMLLWGVDVLCMAWARHWADLSVMRAIQGALECSISPAFLLIVGSFYTRQEQVLRTMIYASSNAGFGLIMDLIMYRLGKIGGPSPWKYISYFLGGLTMLLAVWVFLILGTPREVSWLSQREKRMAQARVAQNGTGSDRTKKGWNSQQAWEALKDPQTHFFFWLTIIAALPNGGITTFGNLIYTSFHFSALDALLKGTIPRNALSVCWFLFVGVFCYKKPNNRFWFMIISCVPGFVGMIMIGTLPTTARWGKWAGFFMSVTVNAAPFLFWTLFPSNVAGRTKKTVVSTVMFVAYCAGNACGSQMFQARDAPTYIPAMIACSVLFATEIVLYICWRQYYVYANNKKARQFPDLPEEERIKLAVLAAEQDQTDMQNPYFRYTL